MLGYDMWVAWPEAKPLLLAVGNTSKMLGIVGSESLGSKDAGRADIAVIPIVCVLSKGILQILVVLLRKFTWESWVRSKETIQC
jgi:hypothetical protein